MKKIIIIIVLSFFNWAYGQLTISYQNANRVSTTHKGFIENSTLIIESHGAYTMQSLIVEYTDNSLFSGVNDLEIKHLFKLPSGSMVNDFCVWEGDSILKAIVVDQTTASNLYDNLRKTTINRRPGILSGGNKYGYVLKVFPLQSGGRKKVKISYVLPIKWENSNALIDLPFEFLNTNNNLTKSLKIIYKGFSSSDTIQLLEKPDQIFTKLSDSLYTTFIDDISNFSSLTMTQNIYSFQGAFFEDGIDKDGIKYFQLSFNLKDVFNLPMNAENKKVMLGLDLSGYSFKNLNIIKENTKRILLSKLKENDVFNIIVSGGGEVKKISSEWIKFSESAIDSILNIFVNSDQADSIDNTLKKNAILFDSPGEIYFFNYYLPFLNIYEGKSFTDINTTKNDIIVSGLSKTFGNFNDTSYLRNGGRFISRYNDSRGQWQQEHYFIKGLQSESYNTYYASFYSNKQGNIGPYFADTLMLQAWDYLKYSDSIAKSEIKLVHPTLDLSYIVSKKYGQGLAIATTIWPFNTQHFPSIAKLGIPMLGIYNGRPISLLPHLLKEIKEQYLIDNFDDVILITNSDSLTTDEKTLDWVTSYLNQFTNKKPRFFTVNLIENNEISYFDFYDFPKHGHYLNSGYLLNELANKTMGYHFELNKINWSDIYQIISLVDYPTMTESKIEIFGDNIKDNFIDFRAMNPQPSYYLKPSFFIGCTNAEKDITLNISAKFNNSNLLQNKQIKFYLSKKEDSVIPALYAYDVIEDTCVVYNCYDKEYVKQLGAKYNVLAGNRSMVILFPGETQQFLYYYLNDVKDESTVEDYDLISAYPNPFNAETQILVKLKEPSKVNISVYNILGQLVTKIAENEEIIGSKTYTWNGKEDYNITASSGIYFTKVEIENSKTKEKKIKTLKLMMLK